MIAIALGIRMQRVRYAPASLPARSAPVSYRSVTRIIIVSIATVATPIASRAEPGMPRYPFAVGQAFVYETHLQGNPEAGVVERLRGWVVSVRENGQARLLLKKKPLKNGKVDEAAEAVCKAGGLRERTSRVLGSSPGDWEAIDTKGTLHTAKDYHGRVVVADFWYRNCPACILAILQVKAIAKHFTGRPVALLGMNVDENEADAIFMAKTLELAYPTLRAKSLEESFGMEDFGYPTLFIIDQQGVIRSLRIGYSATLAEEVIAEVDKLLGP
jgi:peroxiredoxin